MQSASNLGALAENTAVLAGDFKINFGQYPSPSFFAASRTNVLWSLQLPSPQSGTRETYDPCKGHHFDAFRRRNLLVLGRSRIGPGWTGLCVPDFDSRRILDCMDTGYGQRY